RSNSQPARWSEARARYLPRSPVSRARRVDRPRSRSDSSASHGRRNKGRRARAGTLKAIGKQSGESPWSGRCRACSRRLTPDFRGRKQTPGTMESIRRPAVAGMFYPGDPRQLGAEIDELLDAVDQFEPRVGHPKALIVPHAGYIYSGPVAAAAYDEIAPARGIVRRVVMLGPGHRVPVRGLALPAADAFDTPLGRVRIDSAARAMLARLRQVVTSEPAHAMEHSLEVQVPFLQKLLGEFTLVPLAVGTASITEVAETIECLWGGEETLIVISTDLSHYHSYDESRAIDGRTLARIAGFATDI